ncbi:MAG: methyltransferase domain-containing protein [Pseudomonadota bacterium]
MSEAVLDPKSTGTLSGASSGSSSNEGYHDSRLTADPRRNVVWQTLWDAYFRYRVPADGCVLDIGSGYGEFINNVVAEKRIALDIWPGFTSYLANGVDGMVGDLSRIRELPDGSLDYAFASNLFEHVTKEDFGSTLGVLKKKLSSRGVLTVLQPNYTYAYKEYFDDYTHISVWSHISIADFFDANGYEVIEAHPKFLPLTIKSRLPVSPTLIRAYLASPIKPMGKQMLFSAKPKA